jgi:hypothetical protein
MARDSKKADNGGAEGHTGKGSHELMLQWAQTGLMEVQERVAKGYFVKKYVVLSVSRRINLAKACARYYARKLVGQEQPCRGAAAHTGKRPHELMLEWLQTGVMEVPERVKRGYFVKNLFALSVSMHINLARACAPYYAAQIT